MILKKQNLYSYIQMQLDDSYFVGLHGIADTADIINEYSNYSKIEKAENIMKIGLLNARGSTINLTVRNFGNLNETSEEKIYSFNNYGFYSPSGKETIIVTAIPYFFTHSNGKNIFGGYIEYIPEEASFYSEKAKCISDYLFKNLIPKELILGYYSYDTNSNVVDYISNPLHYSKISQGERDKFIDEKIPKSFSFDINDANSIEKMKKLSFLLSPLQKTIEQYENLIKLQNESKHI